MSAELKDSSSDSGPAQLSAEAALHQDALQSAAALKEKHAAFFAADPKGFSRIVRKAHAAAFRRKPGPAPDPRILQAAAGQARQRAVDVDAEMRQRVKSNARAYSVPGV